jgi:hypothetical protein
MGEELLNVLQKCNTTIKQDEICAAEANEIAMEAITSVERPIVMRRIREAANQGKFQTFIDNVSTDTIEWLEQDLGFEIESCCGGRIVKWRRV